jgi:hypothetical protein
VYHVDALASKALGQKRLGESETVFNERQRERERGREREEAPNPIPSLNHTCSLVLGLGQLRF